MILFLKSNCHLSFIRRLSKKSIISNEYLLLLSTPMGKPIGSMIVAKLEPMGLPIGAVKIDGITDF
jgi:hypothetical protein